MTLTQFQDILHARSISTTTFRELLSQFQSLPKTDQTEFLEQADSRIRIDYQWILDAYNRICQSYPKVRKLSKDRRTHIRARFREGSGYEEFEGLFEMAEASDFLKGGNPRGWRATFDWLIRDANMAKVIDGNYANNPSPASSSTASYDLAEIDAYISQTAPEPEQTHLQPIRE